MPNRRSFRVIVGVLTAACIGVVGGAPAQAAPTTAAPVSASSVDAPEDTVRMTDGGMLRGRLREVVPGSHVVLQIGDDERRIPWADVGAVEEGRRTAATDERPSARDPMTPAASTPAGPTVHIEVTRGDRPVALAKTTAEAMGFGIGFVYAAEAYETLCVSPCDRAISAHDGKLHLVGDRIPRSRAFYLESDVTHVDIEVRPGRRGAMIAGVTLTPIGAVLASVGGMLFGFNAIDRNDAADLDEPFVANNPTRNAAIISTALGTAMFGAGVALLVASVTRFKLRKRRR